MNTNELKLLFENESIEKIERLFINYKANNRRDFNNIVDRTMVVFVNSNTIEIQNKIALVFSSLKLHKTAPLIVAKIIGDNLNEKGGTLIYSLKGLRKFSLIDDLLLLWQKPISYEMGEMLEYIGIGRPR
jgi:hypothetical protein